MEFELFGCRNYLKELQEKGFLLRYEYSKKDFRVFITISNVNDFIEIIEILGEDITIGKNKTIEPAEWW